MLSHCQILRGVLEFKFDITVKKNIWNVTLEIFGAKYLSVTREEHLNAIYFHQHTFSKLFFFFFCTSASESKVVQWAQGWPLVSLPNTSGSLFFNT